MINLWNGDDFLAAIDGEDKAVTVIILLQVSPCLETILVLPILQLFLFPKFKYYMLPRDKGSLQSCGSEMIYSGSVYTF